MVAFEAFYQALWQREPFPWQSRLAERFAANDIPTGLDLPTGSGKTSVIDIAVWALANGAALGRRLIYTVDRRLIVDDVYRHSETLALRLQEATEGPLATIAASLREMAGDMVPLVTVQMRGGMPHDPSWVHNPAQPAVIVSTVDQVGSRLLWRGYGVSPGMRPVHAGLLGHDAFFVLDEVHLSQAWSQTLAAINRQRRYEAILTPWQVLEMSATPRGNGSVFALDGNDRAHPVLGPRLDARKPAQLLEADDESFTAEVARQAQMLMDDRRQSGTDAPVVGIVVNTVGAARAIFEQLAGKAEAVLLTGRIRDVDRDALLSEFQPRMMAGRLPHGNPRPLYVVATQTIEAGADLDFDALVTEHAPLDALRQRFGRLNRLGLSGVAPAVIVRRKIAPEAHKRGRIDPAIFIYGDALDATWRWLKTQQTGRGQAKAVDFGLHAMTPADDPELFSPAKPAPVLMPAHLDLLVQTAPAPVADPHIGLLLHGREDAPNVGVVWRADLGDEAAQWPEIVTLMPPVPQEALELSVGLARHWLTGRVHEDGADVEGVAASEPQRGEARPIVAWRDGGWHVVDGARIRPGDTVVVPTHYGGSDRYGWNPRVEHTDDVAEQARELAARTPIVRLHPTLVHDLPSLAEALEAQLARAVVDEVFADRPELAQRLGGGGGYRIAIYPDGRGVVLYQRGRDVAIDDGTDSLSHTALVGLEQHGNGVATTAEEFGRLCGLEPALCQDLTLAARFHDIGKADPRFQALLGATESILAKSAPMDTHTRRIARWMAGYPQRQRHEAYSVHLIDHAPGLLESAHDPQLVRYLVGTHHGHGRPWFPPVEDAGVAIEVSLHGHSFRSDGPHGLDQLDGAWAECFWRLIRRYGRWSLSYLETVVRLADHQRSEAEATGRVDAQNEAVQQEDRWVTSP